MSQEHQLEAPPPLVPFYVAIAADEDVVLRSMAVIHHSATAIADAVAILLRYWETKYKHLWEQDKDAYMRCSRLLRIRVPVLQFDVVRPCLSTQVFFRLSLHPVPQSALD